MKSYLQGRIEILYRVSHYSPDLRAFVRGQFKLIQEELSFIDLWCNLEGVNASPIDVMEFCLIVGVPSLNLELWIDEGQTESGKRVFLWSVVDGLTGEYLHRDEKAYRRLIDAERDGEKKMNEMLLQQSLKKGDEND